MVPREKRTNLCVEKPPPSFPVGDGSLPDEMMVLHGLIEPLDILFHGSVRFAVFSATARSV